MRKYLAFSDTFNGFGHFTGRDNSARGSRFYASAYPSTTQMTDECAANYTTPAAKYP